VALLFGSFQIAVQRTGAAMASVLMYTAPFWVALFSRLLFGERLTPLKSAALLIAMAGVALVCLSGGGRPEKADVIGMAAGLTSGLAYSMHYVYGGIYLKKFSAITIYAHCLTVGALIIFPFVTFSPKSPTMWLTLMGIGAVTSYAAYGAYCAGLKRLAPTRVSILCNLEPLLTTLLAFVFWDELFPPLGWAGAIMVLTAIFMIIREKN
jgi:drug/metabolite transporter (DMT)-like permease